MTIQPTLTPTLHNEFHFAEGTEVQSTCCFGCWRASPKKPKEYTVNKNGDLKPETKTCNHKARIIANQRLAKIISNKFESDPIENNEAFERLTQMINDPLNNGDAITTERLQKIVEAIYILKKEINVENSNEESD